MDTNIKILVVDDDVNNQDIIKYTLESKYKLSYAASGEECIEMVQDTAPDLILLDVGLPGLSGYDTCKKLKLNAEFSNIPILFVSARNSTEEKMLGYEAGAEDYIVKPFDLQELKNKVITNIKNRQQLNKIQDEQNMLDGKVKEDKPQAFGGFAEKRSK